MEREARPRDLRQACASKHDRQSRQIGIACSGIKRKSVAQRRFMLSAGRAPALIE